MKGSQTIQIHFSFGSMLMRKLLLPVAEVGELRSGSAVNVLATKEFHLGLLYL